MYAGVDEAGRGPVLGPLVVAGLLCDPEDLPSGVRDSKKLTPARRQELFGRLTNAPAVRSHVVSVEAERLSERMEAGESLNGIETAAFAEVLEGLGAEEALVDALGTDTAALGARLTTMLEGRCIVEARIGADASDPVVAGASILAKVTRDRALEALGRELDSDVGSGYPSDPRTRAFLRAWRARSPHPPPGARRTWSTLAEMGFGNRSLGEFQATKRGAP